jgi:hypothetical protein
MQVNGQLHVPVALASEQSSLCSLYRAPYSLHSRSGRFVKEKTLPVVRTSCGFCVIQPVAYPDCSTPAADNSVIFPYIYSELNSNDTCTKMVAIPVVATQKNERVPRGFLHAISSSWQSEIHSYARNWKFLA